MSSAKCLVSLMVVLVAALCVVHAEERIQLCGRDLIRLAVSYCGNSRLRRSISYVHLGQHQNTWDQDASAEDGEKDVFTLAPHLYRLSPRVRRAVANISDICCEKGCSMRELIQFC